MKEIILASGSPRRKELLEQIGLKFKVVPSDYEEDMSLKMPPTKLAEFLSAGKAQDVAKKYHGQDVVIIAADTFVVYGDERIGKPKSKAEAFKMLSKFNGQAHAVITGFTIINPVKKMKITKSAKTKIYFRKLTNCQLRKYIELEKPFDLAGAYAIQGYGAALIKKIEGDYYNVVGLPLGELLNQLNKFGIKAL